MDICCFLTDLSILFRQTNCNRNQDISNKQKYHWQKKWLKDLSYFFHYPKIALGAGTRKQKEYVGDSFDFYDHSQ